MGTTEPYYYLAFDEAQRAIVASVFWDDPQRPGAGLKGKVGMQNLTPERIREYLDLRSRNGSLEDFSREEQTGINDSIKKTHLLFSTPPTGTLNRYAVSRPAVRPAPPPASPGDAPSIFGPLPPSSASPSPLEEPDQDEDDDEDGPDGGDPSPIPAEPSSASSPSLPAPSGTPSPGLPPSATGLPGGSSPDGLAGPTPDQTGAMTRPALRREPEPAVPTEPRPVDPVALAEFYKKHNGRVAPGPYRGPSNGHSTNPSLDRLLKMSDDELIEMIFLADGDERHRWAEKLDFIAEFGERIGTLLVAVDLARAKHQGRDYFRTPPFDVVR